ncbi:hypothetical protein RM96_34900 [Cupriavidus sp. IDO]|nr:hypothetical protein RM96_34900 [Cupriavidus sp. IDO]
MLDAAAQAFREATGMRAEPGAEVLAGTGFGLDGTMRFELGQGRKVMMPVAVKRSIDRFSFVARLAELQVQAGEKLLLVTSYVSPEMAGRLRDHDIAFLDTAGNASLNLPDTVVYVVGRRPAAHVPATPRGRTGSPKQLEVLFALITNPGLVTAPYRTIATAAGVALGTVKIALDDFVTRGLLVVGPDGKRRFGDWDRVVDEWASLYPIRLRPGLPARRFAATRPDWWRAIDLARHNAVFGGEVAAEKLAHTLRPERVTLYADTATPRELILEARLKADPQGEVEIVQRFWPAAATPAAAIPTGVAHPVLVYADLLDTGESRNVEAARQIREQYLAHRP